jgi:hypothetical protein
MFRSYDRLQAESTVNLDKHFLESHKYAKSTDLWRQYINITITIVDIIHCVVFYLKLNSIGLFVSHRKHITSSLRAQQVNAIYRFVTMVC